MSQRERTRLLVSMVVAGAVGLGLVAIYRLHFFTTLQPVSHDAFYRGQNPARYGDIPSRIVTIAIDSKSLERLGRWTGWDRTNYARVIDQVKAADARTLAFDVGFFEPAPGDAELARGMAEAGIVVQPIAGVFTDERAESGGLRQLSRPGVPLPALRSAAPSLGSVNVTTDNDGSVRTVPLIIGVDGQRMPALALAAVAEYLRQPPRYDQSPPVFQYALRDVPISESYGMRINYVGPPSLVDG